MRAGRTVPAGLLALSQWLAPSRAGAQELTAPRLRDSAGIRIIEYGTLRSVAQRLSPSPRPYLELGGLRANPDEELDARHFWLGAVTLSTGVIVVNEWAQLKFFDAHGRFLRKVGRRGQGPGEFNQTREICLLRGDTLLVIDYADGRPSEWDSRGNHLKTFARPGYVPVGGCFPDGTVIVRAHQGADRQEAEHVRMRVDGTERVPLGQYPLPEYIGPLLREASIVPTGDAIYVGDAREFEVRAYDLKGRLVRIIRVLDEVKPLSDWEWQQMLRASVPTNARVEERAAAMARFRRLNPPSTLPAYRIVRLDPAGRIWIGDYQQPCLWTVFEPTGGFLGRFHLPPGPEARTQLAGIGRDHIVVRRLDADGAVHLALHRLHLKDSR